MVLLAAGATVCGACFLGLLAAALAIGAWLARRTDLQRYLWLSTLIAAVPHFFITLAFLASLAAGWRAADPRLLLIWVAHGALVLSLAVVATLADSTGHLKRRRRVFGCYQCGYDLRGLVKAQCPECGTAFDLQRLPGLARGALRR